MARDKNHNWFDAAPAEGVEYNQNESKDGPATGGVVVDEVKVEEKKVAPKAKAKVAPKKAPVKTEDDKGTSADEA